MSKHGLMLLLKYTLKYNYSVKSNFNQHFPFIPIFKFLCISFWIYRLATTAVKKLSTVNNDLAVAMV